MSTVSFFSSGLGFSFGVFEDERRPPNQLRLDLVCAGASGCSTFGSSSCNFAASSGDKLPDHVFRSSLSEASDDFLGRVLSPDIATMKRALSSSVLHFASPSSHIFLKFGDIGPATSKPSHSVETSGGGAGAIEELDGAGSCGASAWEMLLAGAGGWDGVACFGDACAGCGGAGGEVSSGGGFADCEGGCAGDCTACGGGHAFGAGAGGLAAFDGGGGAATLEAWGTAAGGDCDTTAAAAAFAAALFTSSTACWAFAASCSCISFICLICFMNSSRSSEGACEAAFAEFATALEAAEATSPTFSSNIF